MTREGEMRKEMQQGGDPRVGPAPARPTTTGRSTARKKPHGSRTVASGRQLEAIMAGTARERLGPDASEDEVQELAWRWLEGRRRRPPDPETQIERWERETTSARAQADLEKLDG